MKFRLIFLSIFSLFYLSCFDSDENMVSICPCETTNINHMFAAVSLDNQPHQRWDGLDVTGYIGAPDRFQFSGSFSIDPHSKLQISINTEDGFPLVEGQTFDLSKQNTSMSFSAWFETHSVFMNANPSGSFTITELSSSLSYLGGKFRLNLEAQDGSHNVEIIEGRMWFENN